MHRIVFIFFHLTAFSWKLDVNFLNAIPVVGFKIHLRVLNLLCQVYPNYIYIYLFIFQVNIKGGV